MPLDQNSLDALAGMAAETQATALSQLAQHGHNVDEIKSALATRGAPPTGTQGDNSQSAKDEARIAAAREAHFNMIKLGDTLNGMNEIDASVLQSELRAGLSEMGVEPNMAKQLFRLLDQGAVRSRGTDEERFNHAQGQLNLLRQAYGFAGTEALATDAKAFITRLPEAIRREFESREAFRSAEGIVIAANAERAARAKRRG